MKTSLFMVSGIVHPFLAFPPSLVWVSINNLLKSEIILPLSANITQATVLVLDQSNTLSFAAAVDPMRAANRQAGRTLFEWTFATPTDAAITLTSGLSVQAAPVARVQRCDVLIVVAGFEVEAQTTPTLCASLARLGTTARSVIGIDGGPWVMAQSGLLDGLSATTHWEDLEKFSRHFPDVHTVNARYQIADARMTSAGAAPTIDMMLAFIETEHGAALAGKVAASFVLDHQPDPRRPQWRRPLGRLGSRVTTRAHEMMENNLDQPLSLTQIAKSSGVSTRVLQSHFRTHLRTTAQAHYLTLRLTEAQRLVTQSHMSLHEIGLATGFASQSSFARAYRRAHGASARVQRKTGLSRDQI
ncbi:GlxA family transcriptional regulator [Ascidiaceihabitans sp.]|uniref:GlxA family transcriptional regulator n=1 Tax=Ascidiaceihabitans sp. TaxID=1872644 RepID=UPI0032990753